ncbi:ABC transporter permease subunit, partial [Campylobacter fetus]|uniref:ABC transporter permease subunit n=1 Tax=Campylobacter fetus TaxID=196 RepID=UPI0021D5DFD2
LIALVHWPFIARIVESELKRLENLDFYKASIVLGRTKFRAFFKDLLPALKSLIFAPSLSANSLNLARNTLIVFLLFSKELF